MKVGLAELELFLPESTSLKDKRRILKSIIDRVRNKYNVSIIEVNHFGLWQRATIAVANICKESKEIREIFSRIERLVEGFSQAEIIRREVHILTPE
ncbi:MAG TPA: DUF503 domain-containing protein [Candidatus Subteraquimicrobiales bacterium]